MSDPTTVPDPLRLPILKACRLVQGSLDAVDAAVVGSILRMPGAPTDRQVASIWRLLGRYQGQLQAASVNYAELQAPALGPLGTDSKAASDPHEVRFSFIQLRGRRIRVQIPADEKLVEVLKGLRKSKASPPWYEERTKDWILPEDFELMPKVAAALKAARPELRIELDDDVRGVLENLKLEAQKTYEASRAGSAELDVPTKLPLRPYQKAGVKWIEDRGGRALIADEMGIGKTITAIGYLARHPEVGPALVVCPSTLKPNWVKEIHRFTDFRALIMSSKTGLRSYKNFGYNAALGPEAGYEVVVMNYDLFEAETPQTWVRRLASGDESGIPHLLEAGDYAIRPINKLYNSSTDMLLKQKLLGLLRKIGEQPNSNRRKFVRVCVNGTPLEEFLKFGFKTLICDESHNLKEPKAQRTMAVHAIAPQMKSVLLLTGTPILNRVRDIWSQVYAVDPTIWPSFMPFGIRYCNGKKEEVRIKGSKGKGKETMQEVWNFMGASNLEELDQKLRTKVMIRRLKKDVLTELPPKIHITVPLIAEKGMETYRKEAKPILKKLAGIKRERDAWKTLLASMTTEERKGYLTKEAEKAAENAALAGVAIKEIEALKLIAVNMKFGEAVKFVLNAVEQAGKIVLFMSHHATIDRMVEALNREEIKAARIDGRVDGPEREAIKTVFQEGDTQVLVCGIRAASEGLTLTASHVVIFVEFDWNPGRHQQAADRIHRFGQTETALIYYLVAMGTIEQKIAEMIDSKREVVNAALGEGERTVDEDGILDALLDEIVMLETKE